MTKQINNFLNGAKQVLVLAPAVEYRRPQKGDSARDMFNLRQDCARVGADMRAVAEKYGEQNQNR